MEKKTMKCTDTKNIKKKPKYSGEARHNQNQLSGAERRDKFKSDPIGSNVLAQ